MEEKEVWEKVSWSPKFEVSNWGRVKSYQRDKINGRIIKPVICKKGYAIVKLYNIYTKKIKQISVHRLVAETFIPNPENKPEVNHIDENKLNNRADNLNWMTHRENINHGTHNERGAINRSKKVRCLETGEIYVGAAEVYRQTGISHVGDVCNGNRQTAGGFHWEYVN